MQRLIKKDFISRLNTRPLFADLYPLIPLDTKLSTKAHAAEQFPGVFQLNHERGTSQQLIINAQLTDFHSAIFFTDTWKWHRDTVSLCETAILPLQENDVARMVLRLVVCQKNLAIVDFQTTGA